MRNQTNRLGLLSVLVFVLIISMVLSFPAVAATAKPDPPPVWFHLAMLFLWLSTLCLTGGSLLFMTLRWKNRPTAAGRITVSETRQEALSRR